MGGQGLKLTASGCGDESGSRRLKYVAPAPAAHLNNLPQPLFWIFVVASAQSAVLKKLPQPGLPVLLDRGHQLWRERNSHGRLELDLRGQGTGLQYWVVVYGCGRAPQAAVERVGCWHRKQGR